MPHAFAAVRAFLREREKAARRAEEEASLAEQEANALPAQRDDPNALSSAYEPDPQAGPKPSYGLFDLLPIAPRPQPWTGWLDTLLPRLPSFESSPPKLPGPLVPTAGGGPLAAIAGWPTGALESVPPQAWPDPSTSLLPAMPLARPIEHTDSAKYWGAASNASGRNEQLPGSYLSSVPQVPNWDLVPTPAAATSASAPPPVWWLSDALWHGTLGPATGRRPPTPWPPVASPVPHQDSATHWGAQMPAPGEYTFKEPDLPTAPPGVDINNNIELARMFANRWTWPMSFYHLVRTKGPWDFKHHFGSQYENFGNFHYGATAAPVFPESIIYNEAGLNQYYGQNKGPESWGEPASRLSYVFPGVRRGTYLLGDDPWDRYWIERGIRYYKDRYRKR